MTAAVMYFTGTFIQKNLQSSWSCINRTIIIAIIDTIVPVCYGSLQVTVASIKRDVSWVLKWEHNSLTVALIGRKPNDFHCVCRWSQTGACGFLTQDMSSAVQKATGL